MDACRNRGGRNSRNTVWKLYPCTVYEFSGYGAGSRNVDGSWCRAGHGTVFWLQEKLRITKDNQIKDNQIKDNQIKDNQIKDNQIKDNQIKNNQI
jgi:hypothetical protein